MVSSSLAMLLWLGGAQTSKMMSSSGGAKCVTVDSDCTRRAR
jgi:hypothetical protein